MSTPTFAKAHNLIAYLEKPIESKGFAQIIDFLNGSSVKYALITSPTIYTSCIKQFWTSAKPAKTYVCEREVPASLGERPGKAFCCTGFIDQESGNPTFSPHPELTSPEVNNDIFDSEGCNALSEKLPDLDSTKDLHPPLHENPLSGSTTYFSNSLLKEFADELPPDLKDSIDQKNRANLADLFVDSIPEMFTNEHTLDYSSPPIFNVYDDDFLEVESDFVNVYDDPFDSKGEKIKEFTLLIDELDLPCDFLPPSEYDSFISQDFSKVNALPSTNTEDKVKEKQENDKIRTKPDQIKIKREAWKSQQCQSPVTIKKAEKEKKIQTKGTKNGKPKVLGCLSLSFLNPTAGLQENDPGKLFAALDSLIRTQALVDGKRVNIKESSIRRTLRLDDAEDTSCLTNIEIFEGLAKMGYEKPSDKLTFYKAFFSSQWKFLIHTILQYLSAKTTSWNEFSSTMTFAIICLTTHQKFNFSRFVQLIINHQLGDMAHHKEIFDTPSLKKKVFEEG
nr:hypothetical protein [Tanacetum cinerariifolium]